VGKQADCTFRRTFDGKIESFPVYPRKSESVADACWRKLAARERRDDVKSFFKPIQTRSLGIIRPCKPRELDPKRPGLKVCLVARKTGKVIGRHRTVKSAGSQETAIKISQRAR